MIGFYNYSVILTYISVLFSIFGIAQSIERHPAVAMFCLIAAGGCDMFDGKIARAMNRTEDEKKFGIQIDSLCDLVSFGVFPALFGYTMGVKGPIGTLILGLFIIAAVIRLGFFNVMEEKRQQQTTECRKAYQGLPVTSISILLPCIYLFHNVIKNQFYILVGVGLLVIAFLFILDFQVKKPKNKTLICFSIIATFILLKMFHVF